MNHFRRVNNTEPSDSLSSQVNFFSEIHNRLRADIFGEFNRNFNNQIHQTGSGYESPRTSDIDEQYYNFYDSKFDFGLD